MSHLLARCCERAALATWPLSENLRAIATSALAAAEQGRVPGIRFPPRRTPTGERISDLPEQAQAAVSGGPPAPAAPAAAAAAAAPPKPAAAAAAGFKARAVKGGKVPPRRTLTAQEMEVIDLGGAMP